ncbi:glycine zipper domain-containing protein [Ideonella sp. BN130291]|uniref:glycine zipper domain-containing protein n=1 Tax=Ideonella sp. BN130291 TaxID=3112940 RepID=UPI002E258D40|nr:glycine zipper domain-containing protein [Ideonella sp. BN130291]
MREDKPLAKGETRTASDTMRDAVGSHPVGTSVGAVGGLAAGAAIGSAAGPVGTLVGAAAGAVAGALAGGGIAEMVDPEAEDAYWRDNYASRPYVSQSYGYDDYGPAYRYGVDSYTRTGGQRAWDESESDLATGWDSARGSSRLAWDDARHASRDAWHRVKDTVERAVPGDSDRDGK